MPQKAILAVFAGAVLLESGIATGIARLIPAVCAGCREQFIVAAVRDRISFQESDRAVRGSAMAIWNRKSAVAGALEGWRERGLIDTATFEQLSADLATQAPARSFTSIILLLGVVCIAFGVIGYIMQKVEMPSSPIILAVILGPMAESNLRRAVLMYEGSYSFLWTRPITIVFLALALLSLYSSYKRAHAA